MARFGGGTRFADSRFAEKEKDSIPTAMVIFKSRQLGDFIVKDGVCTISDAIEPDLVREFRRMPLRLKNKGGGSRVITITVGQEVTDIIAGVTLINSEFEAFSTDGESGTLRIQTDDAHYVTQTECTLIGFRPVEIQDKYIEMEYTWKRSLF